MRSFYFIFYIILILIFAFQLGASLAAAYNLEEGKQCMFK